MRIRFFLYVDDRLVEARRALREAKPIDTESCGLGIEVEGVEYLKGHWNMGRIDLVTLQLEDCARRLRAGQPGIVRSGVLGWTGVPFHLFEPPETSSGPAHISRFFIEGDLDRESWFPLAGWGHKDPEELFDWVASHRDELLTPEPALRRDKPPMIRVPVPFRTLVRQLEDAAAAGREVLAAAASHKEARP